MMKRALLAAGLLCLLCAGLPVSSAPKTDGERVVTSQKADVLKELGSVAIFVENIKKMLRTMD